MKKAIFAIALIAITTVLASAQGWIPNDQSWTYNTTGPAGYTSSYYGSYVPKNTLDNNTSTFWRTNNGTSSGYEYVIYNFVSHRSISKFKMYVSPYVLQYNPKRIELQYIQSTGGYATAAYVECPLGYTGWIEMPWFPAISAQYWRVFVASWWSGAHDIAVAEVGFYECVPTSSYINMVSCGPYTSPAGNVYTQSGTYHDTLVNFCGLDSIIDIYLVVQPQPVASVQLNQSTGALVASPSGGSIAHKWLECPGMTQIYGAGAPTYTPTHAGSYAVVVYQSGCIDTSDCIQYDCPTITSTHSATACGQYVSPVSGSVWTVSGTYRDTIFGATACGGDSVIVTNLQVYQYPSAAASFDAIWGTLSAYPENMQYQWLQCPAMTPVQGATHVDCVPPASGWYAVIVNDHGCADTSECINAVVVGMDEAWHAAYAEPYPNPTNGTLTIDGAKSADVFDIAGRRVATGSYIENAAVIEMPAENGVYIVTWVSAGGTKSNIVIRK
jgi:hypothetical protein